MNMCLYGVDMKLSCFITMFQERSIRLIWVAWHCIV